MKKILATILAVVCLVSAANDKEKPRVLILGDSISMGYTKFVKENLQGVADVFRPDDNCGGTKKGLQFIDQWLEIDGGRWDVIHFNFGLHDMKHVNPETGAVTDDPKAPCQSDVDTYTKNLEIMIKKMKATGAKLIFATTTPFPEGTYPYRDPKMASVYNKAAIKLCKKYDIAIDDLYSVMDGRLEELQRPNDVHFLPKGTMLLGEKVSESILDVLDK